MLWVFSSIDFSKIIRSLRGADIFLYALGLGLGVSRMLLAVWRWKLLLRSKEIRVCFASLVEYLFISCFYNLFLPSVIGGDVIRCMALGTELKDHREAFGSVLVERFIGFFSLSVIAFFSLILGLKLVKNPYIIAFVLLVLAGFILAYFIFFNRRVLNWMLLFLKKIGLVRFEKKIEDFFFVLHEYGNNKPVIVKTLVISIVYQSIGIISTYCFGKAIGIPLSFFYYLVFIPLAWMIMLLPISISGFGLREGAFVTFFTQVNVLKEEALLLSFLFFSHVVFIGIIGAAVNVVHLVRRGKERGRGAG